MWSEERWCQDRMRGRAHPRASCAGRESPGPQLIGPMGSTATTTRALTASVPFRSGPTRRLGYHRSREALTTAVKEDRELVAAWRGGDRQAGEQLFGRHFHAISRFFRNKIGTNVDDLIQRTFVAVLEGRGRLHDDGSFRGYLFGTAYNVLRDHLRELDRSRKFDPESSSIMDLDPSPSTVHGHRQEQRLLLLALRRVPFEHQVALELMYWEGLNAAEIAEIVGVSHSTMRSRIQRARKLVEQAIRELSDSSELATSTMVRLEEWAAGVRGQLEGAG